MFTLNPHTDIYKDLDKSIVICDEYHPELLREAQEINKLTDNKFDFLFISDDMVGNSIKNDREITRCLTVGRNAGQSSLHSFQGRTLMNSVGRNNLNITCILKQQTPQEWCAVIKEFLSMWLPPGMTMAEMIRYCQEATADHQFFCIDNLKGECYITKLSPSQAGL